MNFLSQSQNNHFYFSGQNCLFNTNSEVCIRYIDPKVNYDLGEESSVKFYPSGALITEKKNAEINIIFINNKNEKIVNIKRDELNEMENTIYDINASVCSTGVLVAYKHYDQSHEFEYYTYSGALMKDKDMDKLKAKIDKYETGFGIYFNTKQPQKQDSFIMKCYNDMEM